MKLNELINNAEFGCLSPQSMKSQKTNYSFDINKAF